MKNLICLLCSTALLSSAANVAYNVDLTVGAGSVTGTITTDGNTGTLGTSDIVDWSLLLNNGSSTFTLHGPLSGNNSGDLLVGSDLTATISGLFFNFVSSDDGQLLFQNPETGSGQNYICFADTNGNCDNVFSAVSLCLTGCPGNNIETAESGTVEIASAGSTGVPEPSTLTLLSLGVGAFLTWGSSRRRDRARRWCRPA